jgi:hypothetical protein
LQEHEAHEGLAATYLSGEHGRTLVPFYDVEKPDESLLVFGGLHKVLGVGNVLKWWAL